MPCAALPTNDVSEHGVNQSDGLVAAGVSRKHDVGADLHWWFVEGGALVMEV